MAISKEEYILRSLSKIAHKKWELFIISRLIHGLDDDEIEFITQQLVRRSDGVRALTDIYFPQFNLHLEIDEPYHNNQLEEDSKREQDIIQITGHKVERIKVKEDTDSTLRIKNIRADVDKLVQKIRDLKKTAIDKKRFSPWDFERRYSAEPAIARGNISTEDNIVFRTQVEALRCFGFKGKGWQRGAWSIPDGSNDLVWFPRLYPHGIWHNKLIDNGQIILECAGSEEIGNRKVYNEEAIASINKQREDNSKYPKRKYIVFAKAKDNLGFNLLRYVGTFQMNFDDTSPEVLRFDRVRAEEAIRPPLDV